MSEEETPREKQTRKACQRAIETGKREDLEYYLKLRRENNEQ